jgi:Domain of unknown function (DUF427)
VRALFNQTYLIDTTHATHVWEHDGYPQFYVPLAALQNCSWKDKEEVNLDGVVGAAVIEVTTNPRDGRPSATTDRALRFTDDKGAGKLLLGLVRLEFGSMGG